MAETALERYAEEKHFSAVTRERWRGLPAADGAALLQIATLLRLGENHFRDVFDLLDDIAARQQTTIAAVVGGEVVRTVLDRGAGRNETLKQLKDVLRRQRYPRLAAAEAELAALVQRLLLPPTVQIDFPPNLDGSTIVVTLRAETAEQLRARVRALAAACGAEEVDEMFKRLEGAV